MTPKTTTHKSRPNDRALWLGGAVLRITYDFGTQTGQAFLAEGHCTDMTSAIQYFCDIDPQVQRIATVSGAQRDTCYVRQGETWQARQPRQEANSMTTDQTLREFLVHTCGVRPGPPPTRPGAGNS